MARFLKNYADAFTDTNGAAGGAPFIYKNGPAWPKPPGDDPEARGYVREVRPASHTHPIASSWERILTDIEACLGKHEIEFTIIAGLSYANVGDRTAFCELVVVIGVPPMDFEFDKVKAAADNIKTAIIDQAGFTEVPVAFREWEVRMDAGSGAKLPALDPLIDGDVSEFRHPFTSTLGLAIALEKEPRVEGTVGLFLRRSKDSNDLLALTCAHVVCFPYATKGLSIAESAGHREQVIALGTGTYRNSINKIKSRIDTLSSIVTTKQDNMRQLDMRLNEGRGNPVVLDRARHSAQLRMDLAVRDATVLDGLHSKVTKYLTFPEDRLIGRVLCADAIGPSSDEPGAHTVDWAAILLRKNAFNNDEFQGNKVWIGTSPSSPIP